MLFENFVGTDHSVRTREEKRFEDGVRLRDVSVHLLRGGQKLLLEKSGGGRLER